MFVILELLYHVKVSWKEVFSQYFYSSILFTKTFGSIVCSTVVGLVVLSALL